MTGDVGILSSVVKSSAKEDVITHKQVGIDEDVVLVEDIILPSPVKNNEGSETYILLLTLYCLLYRWFIFFY